MLNRGYGAASWPTPAQLSNRPLSGRSSRPRRSVRQQNRPGIWTSSTLTVSFLPPKLVTGHSASTNDGGIFRHGRRANPYESRRSEGNEPGVVNCALKPGGPSVFRLSCRRALSHSRWHYDPGGENQRGECNVRNGKHPRRCVVEQDPIHPALDKAV
jgi:hypothetical protein